MSNAARHALHIVKETVWGTTPATPAFKRFRNTSCTLAVARGSLMSDELRPDRQIADFRLGTHSVAGEIGGELSIDSYDDQLAAVLCGVWAPKATKTAITFSAASGDDSLNDSGNGFVTAGFQVGDVIIVSGFVAAANNHAFLVASVVAGKIVITTLAGGDPGLTTEAAGASVTIVTNESVLKAGVERTSFSVLRHFTDITAAGEGKPYHLFTGVEFNTLGLSINPTSLVKLTFGVMGREGIAPSNTAPTGATFAAVTTGAAMDQFSGEILDGNDPLGLITEMSVSLDNGLEARPVCGSRFGLRPSEKRSNLTGSATMFFEDSTMYSKFLNEEVVALSIEFPDGAGNSYILELCEIKFTAAPPDVAGEGSITLAMPFQGTMSSDTGTNVILRKRPVVA